MKRRRVLKSLGVGATGFLTGIHFPFRSGRSEVPPHSKGDHRVTHLTILHTNDLHGHLIGWRNWNESLKGNMIGGVARLATAIRRARQDRESSVLLLDGISLKQIQEMPITKRLPRRSCLQLDLFRPRSQSLRWDRLTDESRRKALPLIASLLQASLQ